MPGRVSLTPRCSEVLFKVKHTSRTNLIPLQFAFSSESLKRGVKGPDLKHSIRVTKYKVPSTKF